MKWALLQALLLSMLLGASSTAFAQSICDIADCAEGFHCEEGVGCVRNTCEMPPTAQQAFDAADGVYSAKVFAILPVDWGFAYYGYDVTLEPIQRWKGPVDVTLHIYTGLPYAGEVAFIVGQDYLVFWKMALGVPTDALTSSCMGTASLLDNPYIANLPPPLLPTPARSTSWGTLKVLYR